MANNGNNNQNNVVISNHSNGNNHPDDNDHGNDSNNDSEQSNDICDELEFSQCLKRCEFLSASGQFYSIEPKLFKMVTIYRSDVFKTAIVIALDEYKFYTTKHGKKIQDCNSIFISKEVFKDIVECFKLSYDLDAFLVCN
jgi:hypothetical protein